MQFKHVMQIHICIYFGHMKINLFIQRGWQQELVWVVMFSHRFRSAVVCIGC